MDSLYAYIEKLDDGSGHHRCTLCGVVKDRRFNLRKHVENIHFPGTFTYTCKYCGDVSTTRNNLNNHMTRFHPKLL